MCTTIKQAITSRETRRKLEIMAFVIFITRVISMVPVPGIDASVFKEWVASNSNDAFNLFSAFTGGSFENFSIFALGITPYISASIIIQLLTVAISPLAELQKDGEHGRRVIKRLTAILAIILAVVQSCCMAIGFGKNNLIANEGVWPVIIITVSMTAGTGVMVWLAKILTDKSIGDGTSILLMTNIVSRMPSQFAALFQSLTDGKSKAAAAASVGVAALVLVAVILLIVYMNEGYHPLHIQYSKKMSSSGEMAETGMIPIKVGISSVMPIIFASSIMAFPQLIAAIAGKGYGSGYSKIFLNMMSQANWFDKENPVYGFGLLIYLFLIIFFAYFYMPIIFNPAEIADSIRKQGGFIPGVRAGKETEAYISHISTQLTTIGLIMLILAVVVPTILCGVAGVHTAIGGTSVIIVVGVVVDILQQIQLELAGRNYTGFVIR